MCPHAVPGPWEPEPGACAGVPPKSPAVCEWGPPRAGIPSLGVWHPPTPARILSCPVRHRVCSSAGEGRKSRSVHSPLPRWPQWRGVCVWGDLTEHLKVLGVPTPLRLGKQGRRTRHVGDVRDNQAALPSLERAADPVAAAFRHEHEDRRESLPTGPGTSGWDRRRLDTERGRPRCPLRGARGRLRHGQNGPRLVLGPSGPSPHWLSLWAEPCPHRATPQPSSSVARNVTVW